MKNPIGILDSGVGGLSVYIRLKEALPQESFIYLGDEAHFPYGTKSKEEILALTEKNIAFLMEFNIKCLVIACHTISVYTSDLFKEHVSIPVIDMTDPVIALVKSIPSCKNLAILGTKKTVETNLYPSLIRPLFPQMRVHCLNGSLLVSLIEDPLSHEQRHLFQLEECRRKMLSLNPNLDALLLACTHFPLILPLFERAFKEIPCYDPALQAAETAKGLLMQKGLLSENESPYSKFYATAYPEKFSHLAKIYLGLDLYAEALLPTR